LSSIDFGIIGVVGVVAGVLSCCFRYQRCGQLKVDEHNLASWNETIRQGRIMAA
jgi:hypothetical protein